MNTLRIHLRMNRLTGTIAAALSITLVVIPVTYAETTTGNTTISHCDKRSASLEYGPPGTRLHHMVRPVNCHLIDANVSASIQTHDPTCSSTLGLSEYGQPGTRSHHITQSTGCAGR